MKISAGRCCFASAWVIGTVALAVSAPVYAELMFVTDRLVLNVYAQASQNSSKVATLETGDSVNVLERSQNYVRVRLSNGKEGWVRANFLTLQAPAAVRLRVLESLQKPTAAQDRRFLAEIEDLKTANVALQEELMAMRQEMAAAPATPAPVEDPAAAAPPENKAPAPTRPSLSFLSGLQDSRWFWPALILASGLIGYTIGHQSLARRIRHRYGRMRIY